ncbi:hypothetical protein GCM10009605_28280 [Nocardiopsis composta]
MRGALPPPLLCVFAQVDGFRWSQVGRFGTLGRGGDGDVPIPRPLTLPPGRTRSPAWAPPALAARLNLRSAGRRVREGHRASALPLSSPLV